jgi:filamentous hemagglutinin family protein
MSGIHPRAASFMLALVFWTSGILLVADQNVLAEVPTSITSSGLNTHVSVPTLLPSGQITHDITGGTRPGNGPNLFHSFGDFSVGTNNIANFLNDSGLPTANILGRVTGGSVSNIFGTIQTTGFGNANLFLMNPAGFVFGPTATLNVGGMMTFTTADYMRLADGARFKAVPNAAADMLLSAAPVAAFGFLGSNPAAITVQGSQFSVADGTGISLVGGKITIQSGTLDDGTVQAASLSAPSGHVNLVSVAKPKNPNKGGEISATDFSPSATAGFKSLGTVVVADGATISTSTTGITSELSGGTVFIRAGQLTVVNSSLTADGLTQPPYNLAPGGRIEVHAGTVTLDHATISANSGRGTAGQIIFSDLEKLTSTDSTLAADVRSFLGNDATVRGGSLTIGSSATKSVTLTDTTLSASTNASASGSSVGNAGDITVTGRELSIKGGDVSSIAGSQSVRAGGVITLNGDQINLTDTSLSSYNNSSGSHNTGGAIVLQGLKSTETTPTTAKSVVIDNSSIVAGQGVASYFGGDIIIHANDVMLNNATLRSNGFRQGGSISLADVGTLRSMDSTLNTISSGSGGTIVLGAPATRSILLQNSTMTTRGVMGDGGAINITAGKQFQSVGSTLDASSNLANGGTISIRAGRLSVTDGSTVTAQGAGPGQEGTIQFEFGKKLTVQDSVVTPAATILSGWDGK